MDYQACSCARIQETGTPRGRGVFAIRAIEEDEIIEVCPVVLVQWGEIPDEVKCIAFNWGALTKGPPTSCIALGWGSMYNHSNPANVRYTADTQTDSMIFTAARKIELGEELTVNYNDSFGDIHSTRDIWFENRGISPI